MSESATIVKTTGAGSALRLRVLYGSAMSAAILFALIADTWLAPYYPLLGLVAILVACVTSWELARLLGAFPIPVRTWFCVLGGILIPLSVWMTTWGPDLYIRFTGSENPNFRPPFAVFCGLSMIAFLIEAINYREPGRAVLVIAGHLFVFFYVGILGSFVVLLRWFGDTPAEGTYILIMTVFTAKLSDIGAFFAGRQFGRNKMSPRLSPGKTVEGAIGGLLASTLFGMLAVAIGNGVGLVQEVPLIAGALFGLIVGASAEVGDLMESLIKRDCHSKDSSNRIPGFGGVLDVVDSVFFSAPVAYLLLSSWKAMNW